MIVISSESHSYNYRFFFLDDSFVNSDPTKIPVPTNDVININTGTAIAYSGERKKPWMGWERFSTNGWWQMIVIVSNA